MTDRKGEVRHVCIYQCHPQADEPWWDLYEEITADELDDYENTKNIVRGFMGKLEPKQYADPSIKNARKHDFKSRATQSMLNTLSSYHIDNISESEDPVSKDDAESVEEKENDLTFSEIANPLIDKYEEASNSVDCFLLFVLYRWESDRYESENRLMIVQLPLREDVFIPGEGADEEEDVEELFAQLRDAFDDSLKKSALYPYQEIPDVKEESTDSTKAATVDDEETDEENTDSEENLGAIYIYQGNGQAQYWYKFLDLEKEEHKDEILAEHRIEIIKKLEDDGTDVEDIDDPFAEIDSLEDVDPNDLPDVLDQYWDSGLVVEIGNLKIEGLTVGDVISQDSIGFYENEETDEIYTVIRGQEPSFRPVSQRSYRPPGDDEIDETIDIPVFPELTEYRDLSELMND